jgi:hypothetical protein
MNMQTSKNQPGTSTRSRAIVRLGKTIEKSLAGYVAAAMAAGVGVLALGQPAEGKIIYTPTNVRITNGLKLDLNHDGVTDFTFQTSFFRGTSTFCPCSTNRIKPAQSENQIWGKKMRGPLSSYFPGASALASGVNIRESKQLRVSNTFMCNDSQKFGQWGAWWNVQEGFLGLKFYLQGQAHYGWARANVGSGCATATLTGYAYETVPNKPIKAGKTSGADVVTVQPARLGHLAHGAAAIPAWRAQP